MRTIGTDISGHEKFELILVYYVHNILNKNEKQKLKKKKNWKLTLIKIRGIWALALCVTTAVDMTIENT